MYLYVYFMFMALSLVLVLLAFYRSEHAEMGIAGFTFLFILSFVFLSGDIQFKTGVNETNTYKCLCCDALEGVVECTSENASLVITNVAKVDVYETWNAGGTISHTVGYLLAVISVIGLIGIFLSIKRETW